MYNWVKICVYKWANFVCASESPIHLVSFVLSWFIQLSWPDDFKPLICSGWAVHQPVRSVRPVLLRLLPKASKYPNLQDGWRVEELRLLRVSVSVCPSMPLFYVSPDAHRIPDVFVYDIAQVMDRTQGPAAWLHGPMTYTRNFHEVWATYIVFVVSIHVQTPHYSMNVARLLIEINFLSVIFPAYWLTSKF